MSADAPKTAPSPTDEAPPDSPERDIRERKPNTAFHIHTGGKRERASASLSLHASCVVIRESGILIRGASGAGKSSFAALLLAQARAEGEFAAWVADDRVTVKRHAGRLLGAPHPAIAGRYEARGLGILSEPHEPCTVLRFLVDFEPSNERLPNQGELSGVVAGVALPRLPLVAGRAGLYEASLVVKLIRMRQEKEGRPTPSSRVGAVGI
ncbi:MAG: hypothetical protein JOY67_18225 [Hyphomicrobiales bacterium]|nr:hypothetical protein [Hyphomicrobiales bacterium]MBV9518797.1 hypothetical protein [Hyphomicrobiales bacterium]